MYRNNIRYITKLCYQKGCLDNVTPGEKGTRISLDYYATRDSVWLLPNAQLSCTRCTLKPSYSEGVFVVSQMFATDGEACVGV